MPDSLTLICQNLLEVAKRQPNQLTTHLLANGLRVHVRYHNGEIHLYISRRGVQPGKVEFATVLRRFEGAPTLEPAEQTWAGRNWLYASWKEQTN